MRNIFANIVGFPSLRKADATCALRASMDAQELLLEMYGPIGQSLWDDGITTQQIADALKAQHTSVHVRINSPGGNCMDGVAIYNLLKTSGKAVRVTIDGLAASAASIIAMAGDTVEMRTGTLLMIHPAQLACGGDAEDMRSAADVLDKATAAMADIYAAKTSIDTDTLTALMYAETWMSPQEAKDQGFCDVIGDSNGDVQAIASKFNLAALYVATPENLKVFEKPETPEVQPEEPKGTPVADAARRALALY